MVNGRHDSTSTAVLAFSGLLENRFGRYHRLSRGHDACKRTDSNSKAKARRLSEGVINVTLTHLIFCPYLSMLYAHHPVEILRFNTCGSVDDGMSTLIECLARKPVAVFACFASEEGQTDAGHPLSPGESVGVRGNRVSEVFVVRNGL